MKIFVASSQRLDYNWDYAASFWFSFYKKKFWQWKLVNTAAVLKGPINIVHIQSLKKNNPWDFTESLNFPLFEKKRQTFIDHCC